MRRTRSIRWSRRGLAALAMMAVASLVVAAPASATTIFKEHYSIDYDFTECGDTVQVVGHVDGVAHLRVGKGKHATAFFVHDKFRYRETWTNASGDFLVVTGNAIFQETKAVPLGGTLFEFTAHLSGQPFTVHDADGNLLIRDRGSVRETIIFDTEGDDVPGGIFIEFVSQKISGPHEGFFTDICQFLV